MYYCVLLLIIAKRKKNFTLLDLHTKFVSVKMFSSEAAFQRCSYKKMFWKYAANLQENTHA